MPASTDNAVSDSFSDTFADPSVILAKDGWWYTYSTADPLRAGDPSGIMHIARTHDFASWEYLGTVFDETNRPAWAAPTAGLWAPDIRYLNGQYVLYYTVTDTSLNAGEDSAIGAATAPSPVGPWTPATAPVVGPRANGDNWFFTIDPAGFTDVDGRRYLYWGSFGGGGFVTRLSDDGLRAVGTPVPTTTDSRYEGPYVVRHDGWYYLMASTANCCAGPATGYSVYAGRSRSPLGPFVDKDGTSLLDPQVGGTPVMHQNGNRFIGVGHHALTTDTTGRTFIVYHGIDRNRPWLDVPFGINRRPMLIDRVDWIDGWPAVRAGAGPSDTPQPAPIAGSLLGITPADPAAGSAVRGLRDGPNDPQAGRTGRLDGVAVTSMLPNGDLTIGVDVRVDSLARSPLVLTRPGVTVVLDPAHRTLTTRLGTSLTRAPVAARTGWVRLSISTTEGGRKVLATVSESGLADPYAESSAKTRTPAIRRGPLLLLGRGALVDNVSVQLRATSARQRVAVPQPRQLLWRNDFGVDTRGLEWIRRNEAATVAGGALRWPVEASDLVGTSNTAGLLVRGAPAGDWIAETKLTLPLGGGPGGYEQVRNYQQAGMIVRSSDDDFARLGMVAIAKTRQTEWARELPDAASGRLAFGGAIVGTAADTLWMRIAHHRNTGGEHLYRSATSRDGVHWTWGAVWTFPAGSRQQVGLYTHGGDTPAAVASFDYLTFSTAAWPADPGAGG